MTWHTHFGVKISVWNLNATKLASNFHIATHQNKTVSLNYAQLSNPVLEKLTEQEQQF
jgi:hypothetical protein